jgi:hypothetical protein
MKTLSSVFIDVLLATRVTTSVISGSLPTKNSTGTGTPGVKGEYSFAIAFLLTIRPGIL